MQEPESQNYPKPEAEICGSVGEGKASGSSEGDQGAGTVMMLADGPFDVEGSDPDPQALAKGFSHRDHPSVSGIFSGMWESRA